MIEQRYAFPHHLCCSNSILLQLKLQVVAIPDPESQHTDSLLYSFVELPREYKVPSFQVTLRSCSLPDYLVDYGSYTERMKRQWQVGDHFEMEFIEE